MRYSFLLLFVAASALFSCRDTRITEHKEWGDIYAKHGIKDACIILRDNNHEAIHYFNKERCITRYSPASTFKIFNSLIALETAVAPDDRLVIKWDSTRHDRPECTGDLDMKTAFKNSCVWYYQEIARRIGAARMQMYLDTMVYGNRNIGGSIDMFWLNDSLKISADEEAGFVKRMYFAELPLSERSQRIVRAMMLQEETPAYRLYYKTGTVKVGDKYIYWVTGFAERVVHVKEPKGSMNKTDVRDYPYFFSQNFEIPASDTSEKWMSERILALKDVLRQFGALPKE
jgi:beta-lactamase class D